MMILISSCHLTAPNYKAVHFFSCQFIFTNIYFMSRTVSVRACQNAQFGVSGLKRRFSKTSSTRAVCCITNGSRLIASRAFRLIGRQCRCTCAHSWFGKRRVWLTSELCQKTEHDFRVNDDLALPRFSLLRSAVCVFVLAISDKRRKRNV